MTAVPPETPRADKPARELGRRRLVAIGLALLLHMALFSLFLRSPPSEAIGGGTGEGGIEVSLAGPLPGSAPVPRRATKTPPVPPTPPPTLIKARVAPTPAPDALPLAVVDKPPAATTPVDKAELASIAQDAAYVGGAPGSPCNIVGALQVVLQSDPVTHQALDRIPQAKRSVANAVMLWDGRWIDAGGVGGAENLAPLQSSIMRTVAAAAPRCRNESVTGPRLVMVSDPAGTMILAVGSGAWRWSDLLAADAPMGRQIAP